MNKKYLNRGIISFLLLVANVIFILPKSSEAVLLDCSTATSINVSVPECYGLVDLYNDANGPSWTTNTNWNTDSDICTWFGVSCTNIGGQDHVTTLSLSGNNLSGTLPDSMSGLTYISWVHLQTNNIYGWLPSSWSTWTGITLFNISENILTGTLPSSWSTWSEMQRFNASYNSITWSLPSSWSTMSGMLTFNVQLNTIHGVLPTSWSTWKNIQSFAVDTNAIQGNLPTSWLTWTGINVFQAWGNLLTGTLPLEWSTWTGITSFSVRNNLLTGTLPPEYSGWTNMLGFDGQYNQFVGVLPASWASWTKLTYFNVQSNNTITGTLPPEWAAWTGMQSINFGVNSIVWTYPVEWQAWSGSINTFMGAFNKIWWTLPVEWKSWTKIIQFFVEDNLLTGTLPVEWKAWTGVTSFWTWTNTLQWTLPPEYSGWTNMDSFWVSNNQFTGTLPPERSTWTAIDGFRVGNNWFIWTLPSSWSAWTSIRYLEVQQNNLTGTLPSSWSALTNLRLFSLNNNWFVWTPPSSWSAFTNVQTFSLDHNYLTSQIPASWTSLTALQGLNGLTLDHNCFSVPFSEPPAAFVDTKAGTGWKLTQNLCGYPTGDLLITKTTTGWVVYIWDLIPYNFTVINSGMSTINNIVITETLPSQLTYITWSFTTGITISWQQVIWNIPSMAANSSILFTVVSQVVGWSSGDAVINNVNITGDIDDINRVNNDYVSGTPRILDAVHTWDLFVSKTVSSGVVSTGDILTYTIYYLNSWSSDLTGVYLQDTLQTWLTYVTGTLATGLTINGQILTWYLSGLAANDSGSIVFQVQVDSNVLSGTIINNSASITGSFTDIDSADNTSSASWVSILGYPQPVIIVNNWGGWGGGWGWGGGGYPTGILIQQTGTTQTIQPEVEVELWSAPLLEDPVCLYHDGDFERFKTTFTDIKDSIFKPAVDLMLDYCLIQWYSNSGKVFGTYKYLKRGEAYKVFTRLVWLRFTPIANPHYWSDMYEIAGREANLWQSTTSSYHPIYGYITLADVYTISNNILKRAGKSALTYDPTLNYGDPITRGKFALFIQHLITQIKH